MPKQRANTDAAIARTRTAMRHDPRTMHFLVYYWDQRARALRARLAQQEAPPTSTDWQDLLDVCEGYRLALDVLAVELPALDREAMRSWLTDVLLEAPMPSRWSLC